MIRKSTLIAGTVALALGILQSPAAVMAHGHGGGHGSGHGGGGHNHNHNNDHDHDHDHDNDNDDYHYNSDEFWSGPEVKEVVVFGSTSANTDPCTNLNARLDYPGLCPDGD
jgi:ABC-type Zn2+ transport system substrate-binding protein/surface adhesin